MSDRSDFRAKASLAADAESPPPVPRWVKAFGIAAIVLVVLMVAMVASGRGGPHSPLRHLRSHVGAADSSATSRRPRP